jgi:hypothetical protein
LCPPSRKDDICNVPVATSTKTLAEVLLIVAISLLRALRSVPRTSHVGNSANYFAQTEFSEVRMQDPG